jgi:hypothetical protein
MVSLRRPQSFVVRVSRGAAGGLEGIVERLRTGEKAWFRGADQIGSVIARMLQSELPETGTREDEEDDQRDRRGDSHRP